jgi:hypothetical protein
MMRMDQGGRSTSLLGTNDSTILIETPKLQIQLAGIRANTSGGTFSPGSTVVFSSTLAVRIQAPTGEANQLERLHFPMPLP